VQSHADRRLCCRAGASDGDFFFEVAVPSEQITQKRDPKGLNQNAKFMMLVSPKDKAIKYALKEKVVLQVRVLAAGSIANAQLRGAAQFPMKSIVALEKHVINDQLLSVTYKGIGTHTRSPPCAALISYGCCCKA
jgi:hypothetical protein